MSPELPPLRNNTSFAYGTLGDGTFDDSGEATAGKGRVESTMTTVNPYARFNLTERVSTWGLAGWGTVDMTIRFDDGTDPVRTDLSMQLGAHVGRRLV